MTGLDTLLSLRPFPGSGSKVGYVGHAASLAADGRHALSHLQERNDWSLVRLFSPEHGFDGKAAAGEHVAHRKQSEWELPVFSLYGEDRSPRKEWIADLDLVVTDLFDLGVRFYTYSSTLRHVLQVCASCGVPVLILDRPTPLAGIMDGPLLNPAYRSFVGSVDLPTVYGWGQGLLATWLQRHDPTCQGAEIQVLMSDGDLGSWVPPSPTLPSANSAICYPMTVWSEAIPGMDVNRSGPNSFQIWAMKDLPVDHLLEEAQGVGGVYLRPTTCLHGEEEWPALQLDVPDLTHYQPIRFAVTILASLSKQKGTDFLFSGEGARPDFFDQLMGTADIREGLCAGASVHEITQNWTSLPTPV